MAEEGIFFAEIENAAEIVAAFRKAPEIVKPTLQNAVLKATDMIRKYTDVPIVPYDTGTLIKSFRGTLENDGLIARWFPTAFYAKYVNDGTEPHMIEALGGGLWWPEAQHPIDHVFHPGTKPNPFMENILKAAKKDIDAVFVEALDLIAKKLAPPTL